MCSLKLKTRLFAFVIPILGCGLIATGCKNAKYGDSATTQASVEDEQPSSDDSPQPLVGKPTPPIHVAKWIKGEPLTEFEPGKIYVVDFWATWCPPCIAAIPHLTELAHKHQGKVEVIGISIAEPQESEADTGYIEVVSEFVAEKGDQMDYRVAVDTPDRVMFETWFRPTGSRGIPTAYIIDQNGLVAWTGIGDPKEVERIVGELLEGKFSPRN